MDFQITQLLESTNQKKSKKAVKLLAKMGGMEALRALASLYKNDTDPEVKDLAIQAGKHIKKQESITTAEVEAVRPTLDTHYRAAPVIQNPIRATPPVNSYRSAPVVKETASSDDFKPVFVSPGRQAQAQEHLESASLSASRIKALDSLVKAFKTNPNYRIDSNALSIARNITGLEKPEFLEVLDDEQRLRSLVKGITSQVETKKKKNKPTKDENGDALWSKLLFDLGIYYLIIAVISIIAMLLLPTFYRAAAATMSQGCQGCSAEELVRLRDLVRETKSIFSFTPLQGVFYALLWTFLSLLPVGAFYAIFHSMVHMFLSTEGTFRGMLDYCGRFDLILSIVTQILGNATILLLLRDRFDPHYADIYRYGGAPLWQTFFNLLRITVVLGGAWSLRRIVVFYRVGCFQVGCVMMFSSYVTLAAIDRIMERLFASALKVLLP